MMAESVAVLLVEDDPEEVTRVRTVLTEARLSCVLTLARTVGEAGRCLRGAKFDVVLMALSVRGERVDRIGELHAQANDIPIVLLISAGDEPLALEALERGADDYLITARLTPDLLTRSLRYARERRRLIRQSLKHVEREFEVAAVLQRTFLPSVAPKVRGYEIGGYLHASEPIGGDFYDFVKVAPDRLAIAVGDASGKGIPGALLMAKAHGVLRVDVGRNMGPVMVVERLNETLCSSGSVDRFATLFYAVLSTASGQLQYVSAGHPRAFVYRPDRVDELLSTGPPVGLFPDASFEVRTTALKANEQLVVYSDGVTDAHDEKEQFFGYEGLHAVIRAHPDDPAPDLARRICEAAEQLEMTNPDPGDDKTVVVVRVSPVGRRLTARGESPSAVERR